MRILIINLNWLGDVLFSTPLIRCLKKKFPHSYLASLLPERCFPVLEGNPYINELISIDDRKERARGIDLSSLKILRKGKFDISLHLHRSFSRQLLAYLAGIKCRIGYPQKFKGVLLTEKILLPTNVLHRALYYFHIGSCLGITYDGEGCDFYLEEDDFKEAENILEREGLKKGNYLVLHPAGNWPAKRWPVLYWSQLSDLISDKIGFKVVITGSAQDKYLGDDIKFKAKIKQGLINLAGRTTIKGFSALLKFSSLLISGDSSPLHIAYALGVPVVGIYGPTSPQITGPFGKGKAFIIRKDVGCKIPCYVTNCEFNYRCMKEISPQRVFEEGILSLLR